MMSTNASYSAVAGSCIPNTTTTPRPALSNKDRRTTVRFKFDSLPNQKDFIDAVCSALPKDSVKCIQTLPGNNIDLTLRNENVVQTLLHDGIRLNGERIKPRPLGFRTTYVYVHYLPSKMSSITVGDRLQEYGKVIEVKRQLYVGTSIETGTRIVSMEVTDSIPSFLYIGLYRARVWHRGQIQTCGFCESTMHFFKNCPKRNLAKETPEVIQTTEPKDKNDEEPETTQTDQTTEDSKNQNQKEDETTEETTEHMEESPKEDDNSEPDDQSDGFTTTDCTSEDEEDHRDNNTGQHITRTNDHCFAREKTPTTVIPSESKRNKKKKGEK